METLEAIHKIPPQDLEAEAAVLGALLIDPEAIPKAIELLDEESFYKTAHKKIYASIVNIFDKNEAVDLVTIASELRRQGQLEGIGGMSYLTHLTGAIPTAANISYHASIVKEKAIVRR